MSWEEMMFWTAVGDEQRRWWAEDSDWAADWWSVWADDVAVVWAVVVAVVSYPIFFMQAGPCNPRRLDSSNSSWLEPRDASWDLHIELVLLLSVGTDRSMKIEVFHTSTAYCTWWFLSMNLYYWVFHLYLVYLVYLADLLFLCTLNEWLINVLYAI